jgi:hypothetical protein
MIQRGPGAEFATCVQPSAALNISCPRPPAPMRPKRTRSFAPSTRPAGKRL